VDKPLRFLTAYVTAFLVLVLVTAPEDLVFLPGREAPLPVEVSVAGAGPICGSAYLSRAMEERFRWVVADKGRVWKHGLAAACHESADYLTLTFRTLDGKPAGKAQMHRSWGNGPLESASALAWFSTRGETGETAVKAFLANQADVARAGADLWRLGRWQEAADTLFAALENDWDESGQAQLYFGLADCYAHLGKPRQAYWYALAYLATGDKTPPEAWVKGLRGLSRLAAEQTATVEPEAAELARQFQKARVERDWRRAPEIMRSLCKAAPWSGEYLDWMGAIYGGTVWKPLGESWDRRAALTRRLASDAVLQARLAELTR
jgi:tetratricopeptide (TPR) repeat protein